MALRVHTIVSVFSYSCILRNKAVADGAIVGILCPHVHTRVAKFSFGVKSMSSYNPANLEHARRSNQCIQFLNGDLRLPGGFETLLRKVRSDVFVDD